MDEKQFRKIQLAITELARAVEAGQTKGVSEYIRNIVGDTFDDDEVVRPDFRCDCEKCQATRAGDNNGDDGIN